MEGSLPQDLMTLKKLKYLNFSNNRLSNTLPIDWSGLVRLELLELQYN